MTSFKIIERIITEVLGHWNHNIGHQRLCSRTTHLFSNSYSCITLHFYKESLLSWPLARRKLSLEEAVEPGVACRRATPPRPRTDVVHAPCHPGIRCHHDYVRRPQHSLTRASSQRTAPHHAPRRKAAANPRFPRSEILINAHVISLRYNGA